MYRRIQYDDTQRLTHSHRVYAHTTEHTIYSGIYAVRPTRRRVMRSHAHAALRLPRTEFDRQCVAGIIHAQWED